MYLPTRIFDHEAHVTYLEGNRSCRRCHAAGVPEEAANTKACSECHDKDMMAAEASVKEFRHVDAPPMRRAMHTLCVECHRKESRNPKVDKPNLFRCITCHRTPVTHREEIREALEQDEAGRAAPTLDPAGVTSR